MECKLCGNKKMIEIKSFKVEDIQTFYEFDISKYFYGNEFKLYWCTNCQIKTFGNIIPPDSKFYDQVQKLHNYYEQDKNEFTKAIELIIRYNPKKILEIGAGYGHFLDKIKNVYNVKASEYSEKALKVLQAKNISIDDDSDTYDFIVSFQTFEHIYDLRAFLEFVDKKLEVGGYLFITVPNNDSNYFKETFDYLDYPPHHVHQFNEYALKYIAKVMNYELLEYWVEPLRIEHYSSIIKHRRKKLSYRLKFLSKIFSLFDYMLIPYFYNNQEKGHTHGVLLKKIRKVKNDEIG